ncbi:hypothetical protein KQR54_18305 [Mycobacterium gordonae]|nr:hypothetical protein [Mycobacterium gordonae]
MRRFLNALGGVFTPFYNADDGAGEGGDGSGDGGAGKTFTQAELDAKIADRIARERKKYEGFDDIKAERDRLKAEEDARKAAELTETQRLQAEKENAERDAAAAKESATKAKEAANKRVIDSEIRSIARSLNAIDAGDVLSFVDKSAITIDDDGNVSGVEAAVKAVLAVKPYLAKAPVGADAAGGGNPGRTGDKSELAAKEAELTELKKRAVGDRRLVGKVTALYNEILALKAK